MENGYYEIVIHGLNKYNEIIEQILNNLEIHADSETGFDVKLILVEALTNSFKHGNGGDTEKAITLRYCFNNGKVRFEVEDMGDGTEEQVIPEYLNDSDLLKNSGRGLFLIKSISDKVEIKKNILIVEKTITR